MKTIKVLLSLFILFTFSACSNSSSKEEYSNAITAFHTDTETIYNNASAILSDYSTNWKLGTKKGNMFELVAISMSWNEDLITETNDIFEQTKSNLKVLSEAATKRPDTYSELYEESKKLFATTSALIEQINNPTGSYLTFNQNVNSLLQDFESNHNLINVLMSDEVKEIAVKGDKL